MAAKSAPDVMTPEQYLTYLKKIWPGLTAEQRTGFRIHAKAWAKEEYLGVQKIPIPAHVLEDLALLKEPGTC